MILKACKSKNHTFYYVQKSYRDSEGRSTTKNVERLGTLEDLKARFGEEDPVGEAKKYVAELTLAEKERSRKIRLDCSPTELIPKYEQRSYNGGYLFLQKIYYELGLDYICGKIEKKHKSGYSLNEILSILVYTRLMYPGSKRSSIEDAGRFIERPGSQIHQVYRALSVLAEESDEIQADMYRRSLKLGNRNTGVVYYDLTNYFFEWEEEGGLVQDGHSKEGRSLPIVQMGLFMDREGFPLAMCIEPGNKAETTTLKPMEDKLREKFGLSKIVVCTDGGLSSYENRKGGGDGERAFVTVQSLKKLRRHLQEWALDPAGWHVEGKEEEYDLRGIEAGEHPDTLFYKEHWDPTPLPDGEILEQRIIVTFSFKYRGYLSHLRDRQVARAQSLIESGRGNTTRKKSPNDARRYIKSELCTGDGELAQITNYSLDVEMIEQESRFDGFYALCTDLEDAAPEIIRLNGGRWRVEALFRNMKTDFKARPVFLKRDDRIKAHFLTCFLSLLIYKYLEKKVNRGERHFSTDEIITTLRNMNFLHIDGEGYIPTYTRTDLTNNLHGSAGFRTDMQIVPKKAMRAIISQTKKRTPDKDQ